MQYNDVTANHLLSDIQKGMLFEIESNKHSASLYIVQNLIELSVEINSDFLFKAFNVVLGRHEILRSSFIKNSEQYIRCVFRNAEIPYKFYDYTNLSDKEISSLFLGFLELDFKQSIDLNEPPLMRLAIFKFGEKDYRIVWTRHHILMGGASVGIILDEVFSIYHALLEEKGWILPEPAKHISAYEERSLYGDAYKKYWKSELTQYPNSALLPALPNYREKKIYREYLCEKIESDDYQRLIHFIRKHDLTVNTMLQGALGIVLSNYCDKNNVIFGTVLAYPAEKIKNRIGLFINTLPIHLDINPSNKIIDYLQSLRKKNKLLKELFDTPLRKIKSWCDLPAEVPLFQCVIDYKPRTLNSVLKKHFPEKRCVSSIKLEIPYPIVFEVMNENDSLKIKMNYDAKFIDNYYAKAFLGDFRNTLLKLISDDLHYISDVPIVCDDQIEKMLEWNDHKFIHSDNKTVTQLFEDKAWQIPLAVALGYKDETMTYQALNKKANQLAHYFISLNIEIEARVAICLKPSFDMIIAILGVLKAGGIYIPIDIQYPIERIQYILQDSQPKFILSCTKQMEKLRNIKFEKETPNFIDMNKPEWSFNSDANPTVPIKPASGMYIIYTSGSTGQPKGVLVEHHSVVNTAQSCIERLKITQQSRILQISSFSFDVSVAEWSMALLSGASLVLIDKDIFSPEEIINSLRKYRITTIILASSILAILPQEHLPDLKVIAPGGEPCGQAVVKFWAKDRLFVNIYGITEAAICSTTSVFSVNQENTSDIGVPLPNTSIYILDRYLRQLPIGAVGEIYIAGEGLARGYINNVQLNKERFINHPIIFQKDGLTLRLYKTGDYGRWLQTGKLECLGRNDEQIKIRGYRIELAEIEKVLEVCPNAKKVIVAVKDSVLGKQLHAYILPIQTPLNMDEIKAFAKAHLPNFMMPVKFQQLDRISLTPNGKIDKEKIISLPIEETLEQKKHSHLALSELQQSIKRVVQSLLQCNDVHIDKNFLDLGFDSLSLIKLAASLSESLGVKVDVVELFTYTNIKTLSDYIANLNDHSFLTKNTFKPEKLARKNRILFADEH